jgi:hypothetical protein
VGSFSYTCTISGLPIEAGDKVRYFLLTENPYEDSRACAPTDLWFPRTFPIRAKYNDYGSVEDIEEGPLKDTWLEGLKLDLSERGWGDNSCHDVPTSKDMTFDALLEAIVEGRVRVSREVDYDVLNGRPKRKEMSRAKRKELGLHVYTTLPGVPTRKRVEKALIKAGLPIYGGMGAQGGFMIDKRAFGEVRVRFQSWGAEFGKDAEWLAKAVKQLGEYATMISAGTGSYAHSGELRIRPKPGTKDYHGSRPDRKKPLNVDHAMIREDVWQALIKLEVEGWYNGKTGGLTVDAFRRGIRQVHTKYIGEVKKNQERMEVMRKAAEKQGDTDLAGLVESAFSIFLDPPNDIPGAWILKDSIPFTVALGTHWKLLMKNAPVSEEILDTIAEFGFLHHVLSATRYWWRPSYSIGPQFGEWGRHVVVQQAILNVTNGHAKEQAAEQARTDAELKEYLAKERAKKKKKAARA